MAIKVCFVKVEEAATLVTIREKESNTLMIKNNSRDPLLVIEIAVKHHSFYYGGCTVAKVVLIQVMIY